MTKGLKSRQPQDDGPIKPIVPIYLLYLMLIQVAFKNTMAKSKEIKRCGPLRTTEVEGFKMT